MMRLFVKVVMINFLLSLIGCADVRLYKYFDYETLVPFQNSSFSVEVSLTGSFKDHSSERITEKTKPYYILVSVESKSLGARYIEIDNAILRQSGEEEPKTYNLDFLQHESSVGQFSLNEVDVLQAGMSVRNLNLDYTEHEFSCVITITDKSGEILLKRQLSGKLKPNYWEERQSDTISKILSG